MQAAGYYIVITGLAKPGCLKIAFSYLSIGYKQQKNNFYSAYFLQY